MPEVGTMMYSGYLWTFAIVKVMQNIDLTEKSGLLSHLKIVKEIFNFWWYVILKLKNITIKVLFF